VHTPWPVPPSVLPASIDHLAPLEPLPIPEYDFSTTRDAMTSMIKSAKMGDVEAFKRGISKDLLESTLAEISDFTEPMREIAKQSYGGQISLEGGIASVNMVNSKTKVKNEIPMVRENGEWKLALPNQYNIEESPRTVMEEFLKEAKAKNVAALKIRCSKSLIAERMDSDAWNKNCEKFAVCQIVRVKFIDPSNADVTLQSTDKPNTATFRMIVEDGMWKLTENVTQHR
jgi:hypothetical protein